MDEERRTPPPEVVKAHAESPAIQVRPRATA
jgi:hypothetical protein